MRTGQCYVNFGPHHTREAAAADGWKHAAPRVKSISTGYGLHIETENAAFADHGYADEIARILRECADQLEQGGKVPDKFRNLWDANGNVVGGYALKDQEEWAK